jgi:hypothetical protein
VNFTREPILETIITPREGYKLLVRSSKGSSQEEYSVDALEVVSFGPAIFYRSLERPKPFLVPVGDFEIVEVKETRVILKSVNLERAIKIGGGREPQQKQQQQPAREAPEKVTQPAAGAPEESQAAAVGEAAPREERLEKRRDRRHRRRRRESEERREQKHGEEQKQEQPEKSLEGVVEGGEARDEIQVSSSVFGILLPPPPTLVSHRYKDQALASENVLPTPVEESSPEEAHKTPSHEKKKKEREEDEDNGSAEISDLYRVNSSYTNSSSFSAFPPDNYFIT